MATVKIAIVGVGNCASSLVQGITYYKKNEKKTAGLMHPAIGRYGPSDVEVAAAFDVDRRKVGRDVARAIFSPPNCTKVFCPDVPPTGVTVRMGPVMDGVSDDMRGYEESRTYAPSDEPEPSHDEVVASLRGSNAEVLVNYLPVGSEEASRFWARCALDAGLGFVNNIPVFIASDPAWAQKFAEHNLPIVGDDIKSQLGATITHRALMDTFRRRGARIDRTYQLNAGGNTDFLNMLSRGRLNSKRVSKAEAVQAAAGERLDDENIHIGPSDYVRWLKDNKVCFLRIEGAIWGEVPVELEMRLSVEDSPNSAGVVIDAIRCCKLAIDRGLGGVLTAPSASLMKHPPAQFPDDEAHRLLEEFIAAH